MENKQTNKSYMKLDLSIGCGEGRVITDVYHLSRLSFKGIGEQEQHKSELTARKVSVGRMCPHVVYSLTVDDGWVP